MCFVCVRYFVLKHALCVDYVLCTEQLTLLLQLDHRGYRMETWNVSGLVFYNLHAVAKGREMYCFLVVTKNYQLAETDKNCDKVRKLHCHNRTLQKLNLLIHHV